MKEVLFEAAQTTTLPSLSSFWICWQGTICLSNFRPISVEANHICQDLLLGVAGFAGTAVAQRMQGEHLHQYIGVFFRQHHSLQNNVF